MKKWIALCSLCAVAGFALALANADDSNAPTSPSDNNAQTQQQQPGTMGSDTTGAANSDTSGTTNTETKTETKSEKSAMASKTCTDENGVTLHRGEKGFKACQKKMSKAGESGTAGDSSSNSGNMDSSHDTSSSR